MVITKEKKFTLVEVQGEVGGTDEPHSLSPQKSCFDKDAAPNGAHGSI